MTPLPGSLGDGEVVGWRLDPVAFGASWDSGTGAAISGGRWNTAGHHAVYSALDPSTAIVEVAVHVGFDSLDVVPRVMTAFTVLSPRAIRVVRPDDVPNPNWLRPGTPTVNQQRFGDTLLAEHGMFAIPSAVSPRSWNLIFLAGPQPGRYRLKVQERFALDPRLVPRPDPP